MLLNTQTVEIQNKLARYCRTGDEITIPGSSAIRLNHYRRLVFNVVKDALETTYPICHKYIDNTIWESLCHDFFTHHKCSDPQVWRMPEEFYEYCKSNALAAKHDLPFLNDLLYFEWLEAEMYMMEDEVYPDYTASNNWLKHRIALNPEHRIIQLEFPVHSFPPNKAALHKGQYFILLFREKETGRIQFFELSVLYVFLLENIEAAEKTLEEIFSDVLHIFGINDLALLQKQSFNLLNDLYEKGFVLGILN